MRQILFNSCCPSLICDATGVISWCNPALVRLIGLNDAAPIVGASFRALLPGSELVQFNERILPAFSDDGWSGVICVRKLDGVQLHVHMSVSSISNSEEALIQLSPVVLDIPHPTPDGAGESEACESHYLNVLPMPIVILDETRVIKFVNDVGVDKFRNITGLLMEQDCSIYDILPDIELNEFEQCFEVALGGNRIVKELTRVDVHNRERRMSVTFCPVSVAGGQTKHFLLMVDDTTDKLKLEKKLHHKDEILGSIPDAVIMLNERGFITEWPASAQRLFGYTSRQIVDKNLSFLTVDMHDAAVREQILLPLSKDNPLTVRIQLRTKTANLINTELAISPLVSEDGKRELITHIRQTDTETIELNSFDDVSRNLHRSKRQEEMQELRLQILKMMSSSKNVDGLIRETAFLCRQLVNMECLGVRIRQGNDYPYYVADGFSQEHMLSEDRLCSLDEAGGVIRDSCGDPLLDCLCGCVIQAKHNPNLKCFTENGSFWTNSMSKLLADATLAELQVHTRNHCREEGYESVALIPIRVGNTTHGIIQLNDHRPDCFTEELISLYEDLAQSLAISLTQIEISEALEQSEARYKSLVENTNTLVFCIGLDLVPTFIAGKPDKITGYTIANYKKDPALWANTLHPDDLVSVSESVARIFASRKAENIEFRVNRPDSQVRWMKATLSAHYEEDGTITYVDGLQTDISEQVDSRQRKESHAARTESLAMTSRKIVGSLQFETIMQNLVDGIVDGLDCSCILLKAINASGHSAKIVFMSMRTHDLQELPEAVSFDVHQCAIDTGYQPANGESVCTLAPELYELGLFHRNSPVMLVPLCASLECAHIIVAWRDDSLNDFNEDDLWFAGQIATLVSSSLATSLLYEHQVAVAQAFQRDMIPSPPCIRNCEIAVFYNPITQGIDIGGGFCDVIELPDDRVVVVIGDVSGKGLESAVQAGQTRAMIRALVRSNPEPGAVIHSLNAGLYSYLPTDSFVTLFYCVLDTTTGSLRYVNAGHEPPMLAGTESGVRILSRSGPMLGILEEAYQETHYTSLINGEVLLCYTDGVTDVLINDEWLGQEGLRDIIAGFSDYEAESLVQTIVDVVASPENVQRKDDQLLVAVRLSAHL